MGKCGQCGMRREVKDVSRHGGGTYRRAGRMYDSSICQECAHSLLPRVGRGQTTHDRWSISGLRRAWPLPEEQTRTCECGHVMSTHGMNRCLGVTSAQRDLTEGEPCPCSLTFPDLVAHPA